MHLTLTVDGRQLVGHLGADEVGEVGEPGLDGGGDELLVVNEAGEEAFGSHDERQEGGGVRRRRYGGLRATRGHWPAEPPGA